MRSGGHRNVCVLSTQAFLCGQHRRTGYSAFVNWSNFDQKDVSACVEVLGQTKYLFRFFFSWCVWTFFWLTVHIKSFWWPIFALAEVCSVVLLFVQLSVTLCCRSSADCSSPKEFHHGWSGCVEVVPRWQLPESPFWQKKKTWNIVVSPLN